MASDRRAMLLHRSINATERAGRHQAGAREGIPTAVVAKFAFPSQQPPSLHSQFLAYPTTFKNPSTLVAMQRPFFYNPPSPISPYSQFDVPLTSTLHSLQFPSPYQVPPSTGQSSHFWPAANPGSGEVRRGPTE
jgi:hypothetical protein